MIGRVACILLLMVGISGVAHAVSIPIQYTECDESVNANLSHTTIHYCIGQTCTDFAPLERVDATSPTGNGAISISVEYEVAPEDLPKTIRLAVTCTTTTANEGARVVPTAGNPITFPAP